MDMLNNILSNRIFNRYAVFYATIIGVLVFIWTIASIGWHLYQNYQDKKEDYTAAPIVSSQQVSNYRVNDIISAHLFGDPSVAKRAVKAAPKTTLDLTLQGILSADDSKMARAIIAVSKNKAKLYHIGEKIDKTNVVIKEIRANEVLLNRNGAIESLPLIKKSSSGNRSIVAYSEASKEKQSNAQQGPKTAAPAPPRTATPRPIKKPNARNFRGLDNALKKMGEI